MPLEIELERELWIKYSWIKSVYWNKMCVSFLFVHLTLLNACLHLKQVFLSPRRNANLIHYSIQVQVHNCLGKKHFALSEATEGF